MDVNRLYPSRLRNRCKSVAIEGVLQELEGVAHLHVYACIHDVDEIIGDVVC
jgi:hypothetical protein